MSEKGGAVGGRGEICIELGLHRTHLHGTRHQTCTVEALEHAGPHVSPFPPNSTGAYPGWADRYPFCREQPSPVVLDL